MAWEFQNGDWVWIPEGGDTGGGGDSGGGGGGGGGNPFSLIDSANAYAQQRAGYSPGSVMQEGTVTYRDGVPGVMIKYNTPQGSSTEWTPLQNYDGSSIPAGDIASGGGGGGGGGGSAVSSDLMANPYYQQIKSILDAQGTAEAANTRSAIQQALISYGLVPGGFQDKMNALDDLTMNLIAKNTESGISSYARLLQGKTDSIKDFVNRLSSRGLRRSGSKGFGLRRGQLDFDRVFQDSLSQLLGYTGGLYSTFSNNQYNRQLQLAMFLSQLSQQYTGPSNTPSTNPSTNPSTTVPPGRPPSGYIDPSNTYGGPSRNPYAPISGGPRGYY